MPSQPSPGTDVVETKTLNERDEEEKGAGMRPCIEDLGRPGMGDAPCRACETGTDVVETKTLNERDEEEKGAGMQPLIEDLGRPGMGDAPVGTEVVTPNYGDVYDGAGVLRSLAFLGIREIFAHGADSCHTTGFIHLLNCRACETGTDVVETKTLNERDEEEKGAGMQPLIEDLGRPGMGDAPVGTEVVTPNYGDVYDGAGVLRSLAFLGIREIFAHGADSCHTTGFIHLLNCRACETALASVDLAFGERNVNFVHAIRCA
ncbi:hypothetical protein DFP72DRAFT_844483 [Ephemerocybe angulata]|uniref:Uncharacterized protein n=1 Tax=Ephemerocybe angulata TaxID=980116 RepID=A0A8H6I7B2_9AGAR|nr:hypothetical protein DFP72DRAFT_844483 [Tulosesus angulatus]